MRLQPVWLRVPGAWRLVSVALILLVGLTLAIYVPQTVAEPAPEPSFTWITADNPLPEELDSAAAAIVNHWLYVMGGRNSQGSPIDTIYRAQLNADGSVGPWSAVGILPKPLFGHGAAVVRERVYVVGGYSGAYEGLAYMTQVDPITGELGAWQTMPALPAGQERATHGTVAVAGYLYVLGGVRISDILGTVYSAPIQSNGRLGLWTSTTGLPRPLYRLTASAYNRTVYAVGGRPDSSSVSRKIYRAAIGSGGQLAAWDEVGDNILPGGRADHISLVAKDRLYVIGGTDGNSAQDSVYTFELPGGEVPLLPNPPLPQPRYRMAGTLSPVLTVYIAGGLDGSSPQQAVYYAQVDRYEHALHLPVFVKDYAVPTARPVTDTPTPTSTATVGTATPTPTPTYSPTATPTRAATHTATSTASATPTRTATGTPTASVSPTASPTTGGSYVFQGVIVERQGISETPIPEFERVELYASNSPAERTTRLDDDRTGADGSFTLETDDTSFSYYHIWLEVDDDSPYLPWSANAGASGGVVSPTWIRYWFVLPNPDTYDGNKFSLIRKMAQFHTTLTDPWFTSWPDLWPLHLEASLPELPVMTVTAVKLPAVDVGPPEPLRWEGQP